MPLNCNCYPGCWWDHSRDWKYTTDSRYYYTAKDMLPYGTYVLCNNDLRIETEELLDILLKKVN